MYILEDLGAKYPVVWQVDLGAIVKRAGILEVYQDPFIS
jgi:hypothetical protein